MISQNLEDLSSVMNINEVSRAGPLRERSLENSARVSQSDIPFEKMINDCSMPIRTDDLSDTIQGGVLVSKSKARVVEDNPLMDILAKKTESHEGRVDRKKIILTEPKKIK